LRELIQCLAMGEPKRDREVASAPSRRALDTSTALRERGDRDPHGAGAAGAFAHAILIHQHTWASPPAEAFAVATAGQPTRLPHLQQMEAAFGQSFAGVRAHVGTGAARRGLSTLGARAAAFGDCVAFAESAPEPRLVAHELAHLVQQGQGTSHVQTKATSVSKPGDAPEAAADRAAEAVVRGQAAPDVGTADGGTLHLTTINTNGGVFDNGPRYSPVHGTGAVGDRVGANIMADFTASDLVEAPANGIALLQTISSQTDRVGATTTLNPTRDQWGPVNATDADQLSIIANGATATGRSVDLVVHRPGRTDTNTSPLYGVGFGAPAPATTLRDGTPTVGRTVRGSHIRNPDGTLAPPVPARMEDGPGQTIQLANQTFAMQFELAALVTDGPMASIYLGSVQWGWSSDTSGTVTLLPFTALASGAPTLGFMGAAQVWNSAVFHNPDGTTADTVDLPITSLPSGVQAAVDLPGPDLVTRLAAVDAELSTLPFGPTIDRANKMFERRALDAELRRRHVEVELRCDRLSDTGSAAVPAEDEVWLALEPPAGTLGLVLTGQRVFRAGDSHLYRFAVADLMPMDGAIHVEVNEHDRAGARFAAHDDVLIALDWALPFAPVTITAAGSTYQATVRFDR
jgi:hypothetical protein